jgi:hypothetical protein
VWNRLLSIPAKEFEFTVSEFARIKVAIETWGHYGANADRGWLAPLLTSLGTPERNF